MQRIIALGLLLLMMAGCGQDPDSEGGGDADDLSQNLHFASPSDRADDKIVDLSYIVSFRNILDEAQQNFGDFHQSFRAHALALSQRWARPSSFGSFRYLSTLNLSDLGSSFAAARQISVSPWLRQRPAQTSQLASLVEIKFNSEDQAQATLTQWYKERRIWFAEPNFKSDVSGDIEDNVIAKFGSRNNVPWLEQINFFQALENLATVADKAQPLIAVMDSGVDVEHPALKEAIYANEASQNKLCKGDLYGCNTTKVKGDELGNGKVFPVGTSEFGQSCSVLGDDELKGRCEHGTHVAGIIAARDNDQVTGICPYCRILVVSVVDIESKGGKVKFVIPDVAILAGLAYVSGFKESGQPLVRVINASFGKFDRSRSVELFVRALRKFSRGTLMIAAAGNEDTMRRQYPAAFEDVLSVANVENSLEKPIKARSSNFGSWVKIAAPGDGLCEGTGGAGILSSAPGAAYVCKVGTSMASPVTAGVAGLLLTAHPELSADAVADRLIDTAIPDILYQDGMNNAYRPTIKGKVVPLLGAGIVNALGVLRPEDDLSPSIATRREDRVQPGCGRIGGGSASRASAAVWCLSLPLLWMVIRRRKAA